MVLTGYAVPSATTVSLTSNNQKIAVPAVRISGFVAALRRVLNVDGYAVLEVDEPSDSLALNRDLLRKQFELP